VRGWRRQGLNMPHDPHSVGSKYPSVWRRPRGDWSLLFRFSTQPIGIRRRLGMYYTIYSQILGAPPPAAPPLIAPVPCNCLRVYCWVIFRAQYRGLAIICAVIYLSVCQLLVDSCWFAQLLTWSCSRINKSLRYYSFAVNLNFVYSIIVYC